MGCPHTWFRPNQRVWVHLKNGERFEDRYVERTRRSSCVKFRERGVIKVSKIRAISIYRGQDQ